MEPQWKNEDTNVKQWIGKIKQECRRNTVTDQLDKLSHYVAESMFFMFEMSQSLLLCTLQLYIYYIVCSNMPRSPDSQIQASVAFFLSLHKCVTNVPSIFFALFCGSWSDRIGRQLPVMLCSAGAVFANVYYVISLFMTYTVALLLVFIAGFIRACFGKSATFKMAIYSYVTDMSSEDERMRRLSRTDAMNYAGCLAGSLIGGVFINDSPASYSLIFAISALLCCATYLQAHVFMVESIPRVESTESMTVESIPQVEQKVDNIGIKMDSLNRKEHNSLSRYIPKSLYVLVQYTPDGVKVRWRLILALSALSFIYFIRAGELDTVLLYVKRAPLQASSTEYVFMATCVYLTMGFVQFAFSCSKCHACSEFSLIIIGLAFKSVSLAMLIMSTEVYQVYVALIVGSPISLAISGLSSMLSKTVGENDIGKAFSLLTFNEIIADLLGSLCFNYTYIATADVYFPAFIFALEAGCTLAMIMVTFCILAKQCIGSKPDFALLF